MNYQSELKAFHARLEVCSLSSGQVALWYALLYIKDKCGWKEWFTVANSVLSAHSGLGKGGISKAREKLMEENFIDYKENNGKAASYKLYTLSESGWDSRPVSRTDSIPLSKQVEITQCKSVPHSRQDCKPNSRQVEMTQYKSRPVSRRDSVPVSRQVEMTQCKSVPVSKPVSLPQYDSEPLSVPDSEPLYKYNNNIYISSINLFDIFFNSYPKTRHSNKILTEQEYIRVLELGVTEEDLVKCAKNYAETCSILKIDETFIKSSQNFLKDMMFDKYLPKNYICPNAVKKNVKENNFTSFPQREYTQQEYADIEKKLLQRQH